MTRAVLADAGPLYAAADANDVHHERAQEQADRLNKEKRQILVAYPTFLETHALVLSRMGTSAAFRWLAYLSDAAFVNPTPEDYREAVARIQSFPDQHITLSDATVAILAIRLELEVWTYGRHFDVMQVPVWR